MVSVDQLASCRFQGARYRDSWLGNMLRSRRGQERKLCNQLSVDLQPPKPRFAAIRQAYHSLKALENDLCDSQL